MRSTTLTTLSPLIFILLMLVTNGHAQPMPFNQRVVDSIKAQLPLAKDDTIKVRGLIMLAQMYIRNVDSAMVMKYAVEANAISKKIDYRLGRIDALGQMAFFHAITDDWPKAIMEINEALTLCEEKNWQQRIYLYSVMFMTLSKKRDTKEAKPWALRALRDPHFQSSGATHKWPTYMQLGLAYEQEGQLDSAEFYADILKGYVAKYNSPDMMEASGMMIGDLARKKKKYNEAIHYYRIGKRQNLLGLALTYDELNNIDSAIYYAKAALQSARTVKDGLVAVESAKLLARRYSTIDPKTSNEYLKLYVDIQDEVFNNTKLKALEEIKLNELKNQFDKENQEARFRNSLIQIALIGVAVVFLIAALVFFKSNRIKQTANKKLQQAYSALEATQAQLIQSEKMASLGELTAGIAHEIQNPLNFVNNFSEVNKELLSEMKEEIEKGNIEEAKSLAINVIGNQEKINEHGKRADAIVKGMLQHSRSSSGVKEQTNINALAEEYVKLAYHGLRAKDKSFNAALKTSFDEGAGTVNVIPQDIGRVIINLINNAFYAVSEKSKLLGDQFEPMISIATKKSGDKILISVKDNADGIPEKVRDKIFQPFFTTKPTGEGTGLGLSLSYDIIKAHGGELKVDTKEGQGSEFIILLPVG
ncbi:MAG TPA: ATP-binding protein [Chryseolinea sp.]|nr:ATP-binding protein [Chryseolinea sp.]